MCTAQTKTDAIKPVSQDASAAGYMQIKRQLEPAVLH